MNTSNLKPNEFLLGGDLRINRLGFGAMRLSASGMRGEARDPEVGCAVLKRAVELGANLIDTAQFYHSTDKSVYANDLIRKTLHPYSNIVVATKVGVIFDEKDHHRHATGSEMRMLVEENLKSLNVDCLDLVYLRIGEMTVPHGESLAERYEGLAALQAEGLIRHLGLSNVDTVHLAEAQAIAPVVAIQNNFSVTNRSDTDLLDACAESNIAFSPFFPLGGGMTEISDEKIKRVAARHGATPAQIRLAWLLDYSPVTLAIPGTGSISHLEENMGAADIRLTEEDHADLA